MRRLWMFINMNPEAESVETQLPGLQDKVLGSLSGRA